MKLFAQYFAVAVAGSFGAMLRLFIARSCGRWLGTGFPIGTFIINISGSLFLGWFLTIAGSRALSETTRIAIAVGFVGAYTTFSTFMYESNSLIDNRLFFKASINLIGSLVIGLLAVRAGIWLGRG